MNSFCFKSWLLEEAARHATMRQSLSPRQLADFTMEVGDIIHFGPKTTEGGVITPKFGVIKAISGNTVTVLRFNDAKLVTVPKNQLFEAPYSVVNGRFPTGSAPAVAVELEDYFKKSIIKRQQVWMKLTPKQYKRYEKFLATHDTSEEKMNPDELMSFLSDMEDDMGFEEPVSEPQQPNVTSAPQTTSSLFGQEIPKPPEVRHVPSLSDRLKLLRGKKPEQPITAKYTPSLRDLTQIRKDRKITPEWVALRY